MSIYEITDEALINLVAAALDEFATDLGKEGNISWKDYYTEENIKTWIANNLFSQVQDVP